MIIDRQHIARISWGKDSLKMLEVIHSRGLPLDRITTTDVWATDTISANLPPMEAFKERMQQRIWDMYHIEVERLCARNKDGSKRTYEQMFYHIPNRRSQSIQVERERERRFPQGSILGFPDLHHPWCQAGLKRNATHPAPRDNQGIPSVQRGIALVPASQDPGIRGYKDFRQQPPHGVESSRSIMYEPLFTRPDTTGQVKYRGIHRYRSGRACPVRTAQ